MDKIFNTHPHHALRAAFHFSNGETDTKRAADFFCVSQRTVQNWLACEHLPPWAVKLLDIHLRGYLPKNEAWQGFHVIDDKIHFYGYYGARQVSAKQLMMLDYALPSASDSKNALFWDKYLKKDTLQAIKKRAH
tara:strand:- start:7532 stop:7933 length:402 start_codon:yes stop_codon:yes gene_type:complete